MPKCETPGCQNMARPKVTKLGKVPTTCDRCAAYNLSQRRIAANARKRQEREAQKDRTK